MSQGQPSPDRISQLQENAAGQMVQLLIPDMPSPQEILPWLNAITENRRYTNFGPLAMQFETEVADRLGGAGTVWTVAVASGTAGLELALDSLGLPTGSWVLLPSLSFPASALAVLRTGLKPLLCDTDSRAWCLTPEHAARTLRQMPAQTVGAVMPVTIFGMPADSYEWDRFSAKFSVPVVVDAASGFGNQTVGNRTTTVFSLHATKPFAAGEGGIVATRNKSLTDKVRGASNFGFDCGVALRQGTNAKFSEYHAAVGLASLRRWPEQLQKRQSLTKLYYEGLRALYPKVLPGPNESRVHPVMAVYIRDGVSDQLIQRLLSKGVQTRRWYWPPLHSHPAFRDEACVGNLAGTEDLAQHLLGLPFHLELSAPEIEQVCSALAEALP